MEKKELVKVEKFYPVSGDGPTKAFCELLLLDTFVVKGLRVVDGKNGLFVSMPREKGRDGKWYNTFYPVSRDVQKDLEGLILEQYNTNKQ